MKSLSELQHECERYGLDVANAKRPSRSTYLVALRDHLWQRDHPGKPLPDQLMPMLLQDWGDLAPNDAESLSADHHLWCVQPKLDGVRVLLHVESGGVRLTAR